MISEYLSMSGLDKIYYKSSWVTFVGETVSWLLSVALCQEWNLLSWIIYPSTLSSVGQISALGGRGARESGGPSGEHPATNQRPGMRGGWPIRGQLGPRSLGDQEPGPGGRCPSVVSIEEEATGDWWRSGEETFTLGTLLRAGRLVFIIPSLRCSENPCFILFVCLWTIYWYFKSNGEQNVSLSNLKFELVQFPVFYSRICKFYKQN